MKVRTNPLLMARQVPGEVFELPRAVVVQGQEAKARLRAKDRGSRKKFIQARNAEDLAQHLPLPEGGWLQGLVPGDFVFGDILPVLARYAKPKRILISTLSMSKHNVDTLVRMREDLESMLVLVSTYWRNTDKQGVQWYFNDVAKKHDITVKQVRIHAKISVMLGDSSYVMAGSANLRSSDSIEHFTLINSDELAASHEQTFEWLADNRGALLEDKPKYDSTL